MGTTRLRKFVSAIVMGTAIPVLHYTGMAAASFTISNSTPDLSHSVTVLILGAVGVARNNLGSGNCRPHFGA